MKHLKILFAILIGGCAIAKPLSNNGILILRPHIQEGAYTQTTIASYTKAAIDHLSLELYKNETLMAQRTLSNADLDRVVTFANLQANSSYRIKALAYTSGNALISTEDSNSWTDVTLTNEDHPTLATLKVKLIDRAFAGTGTSSLAVTPGGYIAGDPENLGFVGMQGIVTTIAGNGATGNANGQGTSATFYFPRDLAVDPAGNIYVADRENRLIRKITTTGMVSTVAGNGLNALTDGLGTAASFKYPLHLALDSNGNLFVSDYAANAIRKIEPNGNVTTFAGNGSIGTADGQGTSATFYGPTGLYMDPANNLYVSDRENRRIRVITPGGMVSTFAGSGGNGTVDGSKLSASFMQPSGLTMDAAGNLYVIDYMAHKIRKIKTDGTVVTFAGSGVPGFLDGPASSAQMNGPYDLTIDAQGNLYFPDTANNCIRKVYPSGYIATLAGGLGTGLSDGTSNRASFNNPFGIDIDSQGHLYIADFANHAIRKVE